MLELLELCWNFVWSTVADVAGLVEQAGLFVWELVVLLHVSNPRLEGLLVGVALAWLLSRKDKHPVLRAASAPLNLILNILDLAWDQVVEFLGDVWNTAVGWVTGGLNWCRSMVASCWDWSLNKLKAVGDVLSKQKDE
jgi:hypothetical protein